MSFWTKLKPDFFADSIYQIDGAWLASRNISALIIDVDNTIMARDARLPGQALRAWTSGLKTADIEMLAVSNNWTERVKKIAEALDLPLIAPAAKPFGPVFKRAIAKLGRSAEATAIVGDQLFTDILGGNRAGIRTIMVAPVSDVDMLHTKVFRVFEKALLKRLSGRVLVDGHWQDVAKPGGRREAGGGSGGGH